MKNNKTKTYKISGMECTSCAMVIEGELEDMGIKAKCSYAKETLEIEDNGKISEDKIKSTLTKLGYKLEE